MSEMLEKERFNGTARDNAGQLLGQSRPDLNPDAISDVLDLVAVPDRGWLSRTQDHDPRKWAEAAKGQLIDWDETIELRGEVVPPTGEYSRGDDIKRLPLKEAVRRVVEEGRRSAFIVSTGERPWLQFDEIHQLTDRPDYPFRKA